MKIELIERDGKYFIRKKGRIFTLWWNEGWDGGWELFRQAMTKGEAESVFDRLTQEAFDKTRFDAAPEIVIKTLIP